MSKPQSNRIRLLQAAVAAVALVPCLAFAQTVEPVDLDVVAQIRHEAFNRSQVAANLKELLSLIHI